MQAQKSLCGGPGCLMAVTASLVAMAGTIPFLTCQISEQDIAVGEPSQMASPEGTQAGDGRPLPRPQPPRPLAVLRPQGAQNRESSGYRPWTAEEHVNHTTESVFPDLSPELLSGSVEDQQLQR
ncbi:unnamed protein product [Rangifer tarandus platyrhynchus]|uniref:Uncharacterized protein n=1 Tax=Rangifer tarandus platyrhynchus TaxID=3082113 RepID=A0AC59YWZ8_RANTA